MLFRSQMGLDVQAGYEKAAAASGHIAAIVPVGLAWNRAFKTGVADPNPYDGVSYGQMNLWTHDSYHASALGYYLEGLMLFGRLTGRDPMSLGTKETAANDMGFSAAQTSALQKVAHDELVAQGLHFEAQ